jgi:hypothetical protein
MTRNLAVTVQPPGRARWQQAPGRDRASQHRAAMPPPSPPPSQSRPSGPRPQRGPSPTTTAQATLRTAGHGARQGSARVRCLSRGGSRSSGCAAPVAPAGRRRPTSFCRVCPREGSRARIDGPVRNLTQDLHLGFGTSGTGCASVAMQSVDADSIGHRHGGVRGQARSGRGYVTGA